MIELDLIKGAAQVIAAYGAVGIVILFVAFLIWQEKQRMKNAKEDGLVTQNHLSEIIKENTNSNTALAISLTKVSDAVNNFPTRCNQAVNDLESQVDRLKRG